MVNYRIDFEHYGRLITISKQVETEGGNEMEEVGQYKYVEDENMWGLERISGTGEAYEQMRDAFVTWRNVNRGFHWILEQDGNI